MPDLILRALRAVVVALLAGLASLGHAADGHVPGASWERVSDPAREGWSRERLQLARQYAATISTAAYMVIVGGKVLDEWGDTTIRYNVHSVRKSLLSALYGIAVERGSI